MTMSKALKFKSPVLLLVSTAVAAVLVAGCGTDQETFQS
jgi:hypothetical protein